MKKERVNRISNRIFMAFQAAAAALILLFVNFMVSSGKMYEINRQILSENVTSIKDAYEAENTLLGMKGLKSNYMLDNDVKWLQEFESKQTDFNYWYNKAFESANTEQEKNILSLMAVEFEKYAKVHGKIVRLYDEGIRDEARRLLFEESNEIYKVI